MLQQTTFACESRSERLLHIHLSYYFEFKYIENVKKPILCSKVDEKKDKIATSKFQVEENLSRRENAFKNSEIPKKSFTTHHIELLYTWKHIKIHPNHKQDI